TDPANPPGLDPNTGRQTTEFTYSIIYTDVDRFAGVAGNPPDYVQVYIDNVAHTMTKVDATDNDYTDGALYQFKITGLAEATPHTYFFVASDGLDRARKPVQGAAPARYNGPVVDEPPGPPQSLLAQDTPNDNGGQIDLTFNASVDDGGGANDVTEYRIYRSTTSGTYTGAALATIKATGVPTYVYRDTTAVTNQDYYYVVRAWDGANESINSNEAGPVKALDTIPPLPPSNVTAADTTLGGTIKVTWNPSPDDGGGQGDVKEYHVYRATTATGFGGTFLTPAVPAGTTTFSDTTVAANTKYYYMVRSYDGANESVDSNVAGPVQATDQKPPIIADLSPVNRAVDVPIGTAIGFTVADSGTGVDQASLLMTVNGANVPIDSLTITGTPAKLTVEYQPGFTVADYRKVITVTVQASDRGGQKSAITQWKFTLAGPTTYSISGSILDINGKPKKGVAVSAGDLSAVTDAAGNYLITGLVQGTYVVTPKLRHVTFSPSTQAATVDADVTGIDFTWAAGFDLTGRVVDKKGVGMQGVSLTDGLVTTITDSEGLWKILDAPAGTYNVVPSLARYVFAPQSKTLTIGPSATGVRFFGSLQTFSISGIITGIDGGRLASVAVDATSSEGN
ncbi:MAG: carboxypeptidase regulatory-like domain-containing protein, partial [Armatimonadota bacterium]